MALSVCVVSAELGINHGGDLWTALEMIRRATECGCGAVKVQSYRTKDFLPDGHPDWDLFEQAEIWPYLDELKGEARKCGVLFGVTAQTPEGAGEAKMVGADFLKVGSDSLLRHDIIEACLATELPTWVSTGMGSEAEIRDVNPEAKLMLCTSLYPCSPEMANVARLRDPDYYQGFSDHTQGWLAAVIATSLGVEMIEKHFTLDTDAGGPDHWFSADPDEMLLLTQAVNQTEVLLGDGKQGFVSAEAEGREMWRTTVEQPLRA